jgi:hypothetical protein
LSEGPLIILGVDGLDWELVDAHRDDLPTLASWPTLQPLKSIFPPDSIPAWTTIFTGRSPGEHGFLESIDYLDSMPTAAAEEAGEGLPNRTFWDEAGRDGHRVVVINPFLAYPSWDVNGVMVSGPVFVNGNVSVTGVDVAELGDLPELGGIVTFPTTSTVGPFVIGTLSATEQQFAFGLCLLERFSPDLFFLNVLTIDRLQHFLWRFHDPGDPTYPGPNEHQGSVLDGYRLVDRWLAEYAKRGRVVVLSDHGHGRRCVRMIYVDEALRRAGLLGEARRAPRLLSRAYLLERAKRTALAAAYRWSLEQPAYNLARRLPNRKVLKESSFSTDAPRSAAKLSRAFGRNQHSGIELRDDTPEMRERVRAFLEGLCDPKTGEKVVEWVRDRDEVVHGEYVDRYPPVLFKLRDGYGVDFGLYGNPWGPNTNHRRVSGGHKELGVLACSFAPAETPLSIEQMHDFFLACLK